MKGEKAREVETQGAAQVLAVSDAYQGEAGFLNAPHAAHAGAGFAAEGSGGGVGRVRCV